MNETPTAWPSLLGLAALCVPLTYGLAALSVSASRPFRRAALASGVALGLAFLVAGGWALVPGEAPLLAWRTRVDGVTGALLGLVCFIALIILRFSRSYLHGDSGQARYVRWLMATLAAVTLLIVSNNLLVIALAWVGTSLALHQLLTFYADRPPALIAAHKKFLASRVADLCLLSAIALIGLHVGSLELDAIHAWAEATPSLPAALQLATVLLVLGAALKCAQLPFHGWLLQVMEAPTPVSALLHAGVVNIGGLLMLRLAPLMVKAELAQTLLVVIGTTSAVVAALVMTTRVSVKVMLAWSTCAQLGFMLVQCGLGAYSLALLHLIAHSLYKAHAFLSSGSAVDTWGARALAPSRKHAGLGSWLAAAGVALLGVSAVAALYGASPGQEPALWALATVLGLALASLLVRGLGGGWRHLVTVGLGAMGVATLSFTWHALSGSLLAVPAPTGHLAPRVGIVLLGFGALFLLQAVMQSWPQGRLARALYPRLFAGLYLDERFTRLTFRVWPPKLPPRAPPTPSLHVVETREA
jgi:NAD(P)H-quinone oxidoreductase subunit 5